MATGSLLALLDDIATILDDVSVMTQMAAKKTAGVLGDDLALNAQQVNGIAAERELSVVWAVGKGSLINKMILVPTALTISYFAPWAITPLLMLGGAYLCFEGFEKIAEKFLHSAHDKKFHDDAIEQAVADPKVDLIALEKVKIKGAIRTDFILSAEIIVIALGTVASADFSKQATVVSLIAIIMTFGVYGLVAGIVKLDDLGLHLMLKKGKSFYKQFLRKIGEKLLSAAPYLMRTLTVFGTIAMFVVGGSIIGHGIPALHHWKEQTVERLTSIPVIGSIVATITPVAIEALFGLLVGAICVVLFELASKLLPKKAKHE
jgi:predicted DNA repair protein MutK